MPDYGFVRFGQTDSAFTLLQAGVIEAFGDGSQWTLEGGQALMFPSNAAPAGSNQFIYADQTPVYGTDKVVYISPAFAGVNAAVGFEPNSNGLKEGYNSCAAAGSTCAALAASPSANDVGKRRKNTVDVGVQYLATIDDVKLKASADYLTGSPVSYDGPTPTKVSAVNFGFDNLSVYQLGGQATFAGLTLGANIKGGQVEDGYTFKPKGGRDALAYIVGASYVIGPYVVGLSYFNSQSSGAYFPTSKGIAHTLSEYGIAAGANYVISPNMSVFTQYMYGHRHQPGNSNLTLVTPAGNTQVQGIALGATLKW
jgi:predicted porin